MESSSAAPHRALFLLILQKQLTEVHSGWPQLWARPKNQNKASESVLFPIANSPAAIKANSKQPQQGCSNIYSKGTLRIMKNKCSNTILQWVWTPSTHTKKWEDWICQQSEKNTYYHRGRTVRIHHSPVLPDFLPEESLTTPSFVTSKRREKKKERNLPLKIPEESTRK